MAHRHSVYDTDLHFKIDPITKMVTNMTPQKVMLIQNDHNSERFTFEISRYVDGHDMSICDRVEVHYINIDSATGEQNEGLYLVEDLQICPDDEDVVILSWLISEQATHYSGSLSFLIMFRCMDGDETVYRWSTSIHRSITISNGIDNGETILEGYADVLVQWEQRFFTAKDSVIKDIENKAIETIATIPDDYTELNETVNNKVDLYGYNQVRPDNITGIVNIGDLMCNAALYRKNAYFTVADNSLVWHSMQDTYDTYILKINEAGTYTIYTPNAIRLACLGADKQTPTSGLRIEGKGTFTVEIDDNAEFLLIMVVRNNFADYHISFGDTVYEEPIYQLPEWLKSKDTDTEVDTDTDTDTEVRLVDIQGISIVGNMNPVLDLVKENVWLGQNNGVVELGEHDGYNTYSLEISEVGKYTIYAQGKPFTVVATSEDKKTIVSDFITASNQATLELGENAKYILVSIGVANKEKLMINKGETTVILSKYNLPDVFNNYKDEFGQIFPDNIEGVKNVGDLIGRSRLVKANSIFVLSNGVMNYPIDETQDIYLLKITDTGNYTIASPIYTKVLFLDESFSPVSSFYAFGKGNGRLVSGDNAEYMVFTMAKGYEADYHISFGDTVYEEPIYQLPEWLKSKDTEVDVETETKDNFSFDYTKYGLPILYLNGDITTMNKDIKVTLNYLYGDKEGTCTLKWQGSSSLNYPKKNYTITFDNPFEAKEGWGSQKKYCLKANYIDFSHARNVVSAKLWGQVVKSRATENTNLSSLVNGGAVDGFPILVVINDTYQGLYTFNIPKDKWMFGITNENSLILTIDNATNATGLGNTETAFNGGGWEIEYLPDGVTEAEALAKLNEFITVLTNSTKENFEATVGELADLDSFIDYACFHNLITGVDSHPKNYILTAFDMGKWVITSYDMDGTFGNNWHGQNYVSVKSYPTFTSSYRNNMCQKVIQYMPDRVKARYNELRTGVMSEDNVQLEFYNFMANIPKAVKDKECELWTNIPGTDTNNVSQIVNHYGLRCKYLDEQISRI